MVISKNHQKSRNYKKYIKKAVKSRVILHEKSSFWRILPKLSNFYIKIHL